MSKKTFEKTDKKGRTETWEWEETPETVEALKALHETVKKTRVALDNLS
jgi:hypothetical protein